MSGFTRTKRVTDPLHDRVKARMFGHEPGNISSGSEHSAHVDDNNDDVVSESLSDLFYGFAMDNETVQPMVNGELTEKDFDVELGSKTNDSAELRYALDGNYDSYKNVVKANVCKAIEFFSCTKMVDKSVFRRNVMSYLINLGYNAAICKTKWESSGGLTAGNYEFIDIVRDQESSSRYFIELDFASEFQLARPTSNYETLLQSLPRVFVGKAEQLKMILRIMSDAARRSLKKRELHLPPWRKHRFMQNKWFGPYKRTSTTNIFPANFSSITSQSNQNFVIKCQYLGFDDHAVLGRLCLPAAR